MNEEKIKKKLIWDGVINIGKKINEEHWGHNNITYTNGYSAQRTIIYDEFQYKAVVRIFASTTFRPLFECVIYKNDDIITTTRATNPTTAAKKALKNTDMKLNFKNGHVFYGLDRDEVKRMQKTAENQDADDYSISDSESEMGVIHSSSEKGRQASWFGVVSFGDVIYDEKFKVTIGESSFWLQPGYESLRNMTLSDQTTVVLHCKVDLDENEDIIFKCFTLDKEPSNIHTESADAVEVVKDAFELLGLSTHKKWSGYEFFGFMKSDVLKILTKKPPQDMPTLKLKKSDLNHEVLKRGMQVRSRNAGETSSLQSKKSIKNRNNVVHQLVQYVSFGDVKSKFQNS